MVVRANKYYVSCNGNDDNPGLTEKTAWKTIVMSTGYHFVHETCPTKYLRSGE